MSSFRSSSDPARAGIVMYRIRMKADVSLMWMPVPFQLPPVFIDRSPGPAAVGPGRTAADWADKCVEVKYVENVGAGNRT